MDSSSRSGETIEPEEGFLIQPTGRSLLQYCALLGLVDDPTSMSRKQIITHYGHYREFHNQYLFRSPKTVQNAPCYQRHTPFSGKRTPLLPDNQSDNPIRLVPR